MARWRKGEQQVASLIEQRHLQQVAADSQTAAALLASAGRHVESARRTVDADPEACECRKCCHPMRPGHIRGLGRRAGPAAVPGHSGP
jgi:hypothetical protein